MGKSLIALAIMLNIAAASLLAAEFRFTSGGKAAYVVAKPENARPTEARAASELAYYLNIITDVEFQIVEENAVPEGQKAVYVGQTKFAAKNGIDFSRLASEEWIIRTMPDGSLVLTGGNLVGIIYSVFDYLERQCGVRWYDEQTERVPQNKNLSVGTYNLRRRPSFNGRHIYDTLDSDAASGRFKERNKAFSLTQSETGFKWAHGANRPHHTFGDYASDWPKDKAELFTRDANGKPMIPTPDGGGAGQICLTNPEVRQRVLEKLRNFIRNDREKAAKGGYAYPVVYDISQNDNNNKCTCKDCMAIAEKEGSYSATNIDFINWIAKNIAKEYPDVLIRTFAYMYTAEPPKTMRTEPNVVIHMAILGAEFGNTYNKYDSMRPIEHPINKPVCAMIKEWSKHTDHIRHWQYWLLYPELPEPTIRIEAVAKDMKFASLNHISDFFIEYEAPSWNSFFTLTRYLGYKLMDDIGRNPNDVIDDFLKGYYGAAAPHIKTLLKYMAKRQDELPERIGDVALAERNYLDGKYFSKAFALLDKAENSVSDPAIKARIRRERPMFDAALIYRWPEIENKASFDTEAIIREFVAETEASAAFYFPNPQHGSRKSIVKQANEIADKLRLYAKRGDEIHVKGYRKKDVIDLCAADFSSKPNAKLVDDEDAFIGKAMKSDYGDKPLVLKIDNWMELGNMSTLNLTDEILPSDGKYHLIPIKYVKFTNNGRSHLYINDTNGIYCGFYRRMQGGTTFDVFISLKREGTAVSADRIYLLKSHGAK